MSFRDAVRNLCPKGNSICNQKNILRKSSGWQYGDIQDDNCGLFRPCFCHCEPLSPSFRGEARNLCPKSNTFLSVIPRRSEESLPEGQHPYLCHSVAKRGIFARRTTPFSLSFRDAVRNLCPKGNSICNQKTFFAKAQDDNMGVFRMTTVGYL